MHDDLERASKVILMKMENVELSILLQIAGVEVPPEKHQKAQLLLEILRRK